MEKQAVIRRFRILVSVFFGLPTVALCVLWVRSYWYTDSMVWGSCRFHDSASYSGRLSFSAYPASIDYGGIHLSTQRIWNSFYTDRPDSATLGFSCSLSSADEFIQIIVPNYFLTLITGFAALAPWLTWRFSIGTMLIATTLVGVVLGLVC